MENKKPEVVKKKIVLWIEDGAFDENALLATPVHLHGGFDLVIERDASSGWNQLENLNYDVAICDIRLPPGDDPHWIALYYQKAEQREKAQLGLSLLKRLHQQNAPAFRKIGVLTVETKADIRIYLDELEIKTYRQKQGIAAPGLLLDAIEEILSRSSRRTP